MFTRTLSKHLISTDVKVAGLKLLLADEHVILDTEIMMDLFHITATE